MIQEYLFVGEDHKQEVEQYSYKSIKFAIHDIDNSDCWIATFSSAGENEKSANILSTVHEHIVSNFHPTVVGNGCSAYYNKVLYPYFNEFERKLRKLLYIKSALSEKVENTELINDLESKDLGEIFTILFSDEKFVNSAKKSINDRTWKFTKTEILAALQEIPESTFWDKVIGEDAVSSLRSGFVQVKDYRNDIMHAHNMTNTLYNSALVLIKKINEQLDKEIEKVFVDKRDAVQSVSNQNFNVALSDAIKYFDAEEVSRSLQEHLAVFQTTVSALKDNGVAAILEEYARFASHPAIVAMQQNAQQISKLQKDIFSTLQTSIEQYKKTFLSPEVLEPQKSLDRFKPDPVFNRTIEKDGRNI